MNNSIAWDGYSLRVNKRQYGNGRVALVLVDNSEGWEEFFAIATVNLPEVELNEGEVIIKDYSENEGVLEALQGAGIVSGVTRWVEIGFVRCPVVRLIS